MFRIERGGEFQTSLTKPLKQLLLLAVILGDHGPWFWIWEAEVWKIGESPCDSRGCRGGGKRILLGWRRDTCGRLLRLVEWVTGILVLLSPLPSEKHWLWSRLLAALIFVFVFWSYWGEGYRGYEVLASPWYLSRWDPSPSNSAIKNSWASCWS